MEDQKPAGTITEFKKVHSANRGTTTYRADGFPGVILLAKPAFNGEHPESIKLVDVPAPTAEAAKPAAPKQTKEERDATRATEKARFQALSPEEKAQEIRDKAAKVREQRAKALAAADARLAKVSGAPDASQTVANADANPTGELTQ